MKVFLEKYGVDLVLVFLFTLVFCGVVFIFNDMQGLKHVIFEVFLTSVLVRFTIFCWSHEFFEYTFNWWSIIPTEIVVSFWWPIDLISWIIDRFQKKDEERKGYAAYAAYTRHILRKSK